MRFSNPDHPVIPSNFLDIIGYCIYALIYLGSGQDHY